jgi:hypothetical protein
MTMAKTAAISKLKVGVDVPWVTSWSAEEPLGVRPCPTVHGRLAICQAERPGQGRPQYSLNHMQRQRASVMRMLCPMCGGESADGDRWSLTGKMEAAGLLRLRGHASALPLDVADDLLVLNCGAISPGHLTCMERSAEQCPHLSSMPGLRLRRFPDRWTISPLLVETTASSPQLFLARPAPAPKAVIGFIQLCGITLDTDPNWRERR